MSPHPSLKKQKLKKFTDAGLHILLSQIFVGWEQKQEPWLETATDQGGRVVSTNRDWASCRIQEGGAGNTFPGSYPHPTECQHLQTEVADEPYI